MNNTRRLTRRERIHNAKILNDIRDAPGNHNDPRILAYGRPPYPLCGKLAFTEAPVIHVRWKDPKQANPPIPGKVTAFLNAKPQQIFDKGMALLVALSVTMLLLVLILRGELM